MNDNIINKQTFLPKVKMYLTKIISAEGLDEDEAHRLNRCILIGEELAYQYGGRSLKNNMKNIDEVWFAGFSIGVFSLEECVVEQMVIALTSCDKILQRLNVVTAEALITKVDRGLFKLVEQQRQELLAHEASANKELVNAS